MIREIKTDNEELCMGLVIKISAYYDWEATYFVQTLDKQEAKEKAFKMFKQTASCFLPDTFEEADKNDNIYIEVVAEVDTVLFQEGEIKL